MTSAIDDDATDGEDADGEGDYEIDLEVGDDDVVHSCNSVYLCVVNAFWHYFACAVFVHIILC